MSIKGGIRAAGDFIRIAAQVAFPAAREAMQAAVTYERYLLECRAVANASQAQVEWALERYEGIVGFRESLLEGGLAYELVQQAQREGVR